MSSPQLEIAVKAALRAGRLINRASLRLDQIEVHEKAKSDFVSQADIDSQAAIVEMLQEYFPRDGIMAEEGAGIINPDSPHRWIIDPLDGTTNFLHGFPQYAVSIGYTVDGVVMAGVVFDPTRNELFTCERGKGTFLNNRRVRVSGRIDFTQALIGTGFPFRRQNFGPFLGKLERVASNCAGLRRAGAASLDLCWTACGRLDGYWEKNLKPWDVCAGSLMVLEAGGLVTDTSGGEDYVNTGNIVVGTPKIFAPLLMMVQDEKPAEQK